MAIFAYGGLPRSRAASVFREIQRGGYQRIKSTIVVPSGSGLLRENADTLVTEDSKRIVTD